jgi:hypothetical protein
MSFVHMSARALGRTRSAAKQDVAVGTVRTEVSIYIVISSYGTQRPGSFGEASREAQMHPSNDYNGVLHVIGGARRLPWQLRVKLTIPSAATSLTSALSRLVTM